MIGRSVPRHAPEIRQLRIRMCGLPVPTGSGIWPPFPQPPPWLKPRSFATASTFSRVSNRLPESMKWSDAFDLAYGSCSSPDENVNISCWYAAIPVLTYTHLRRLQQVVERCFTFDEVLVIGRSRESVLMRGHCPSSFAVLGRGLSGVQSADQHAIRTRRGQGCRVPSSSYLSCAHPGLTGAVREVEMGRPNLPPST